MTGKLLLFDALADAFIRERHSLDAQQMFYFLRGVLVCYCMVNVLDIAEYEALLIKDIKEMCNVLEAARTHATKAVRKPSAKTIAKRVDAVEKTAGIWAGIPDDNPQFDDESYM